MAGLRAKEKKLPSLLLWNETGLKLFEKIITSEEYYPLAREMKLLQECEHEIARFFSAGDRLVELGAGYVLLPITFR
jgi:uncharacterized SAM-dependent methyltransferase